MLYPLFWEGEGQFTYPHLPCTSRGQHLAQKIGNRIPLFSKIHSNLTKYK